MLVEVVAAFDGRRVADSYEIERQAARRHRTFRLAAPHREVELDRGPARNDVSGNARRACAVSGSLRVCQHLVGGFGRLSVRACRLAVTPASRENDADKDES